MFEAQYNYKCPMCVKAVESVAVPQRLEVGEDSLEVDIFCYLGDVISCEVWFELVIRGRIFCA